MRAQLRAVRLAAVVIIAALSKCKGPGGGAGDGGPPPPGTSVRVSVGPGGGEVAMQGVSLVVPVGALSAQQEITITVTDEPIPAGYVGYTPVYRFEPEGLTFAMPATLRLAFNGDPARAALFWSRVGSTGYERLGGSVADSTLTASVRHFSRGFVGDGIDYTDPPDRSCTNTRVLDVRTTSPSAVAAFFTVDDCQGRPFTELTESDFLVKEDGVVVSATEGPRVVLQRSGLQVFVTLAIDVSTSTSAVRTQTLAAAKAFVDQLLVDERVPAQVSLELFDGSAQSTVWQPHTLDVATLHARLDALASFTATDPGSTNLHGAIIDAVDRLSIAQRAFKQRNQGGAFTAGYLVVFTDGRDTAARRTAADVATSECLDPMPPPDQVCISGTAATLAVANASGCLPPQNLCSGGQCCPQGKQCTSCAPGNACPCTDPGTKFCARPNSTPQVPSGFLCKTDMTCADTRGCCCQDVACRDREVALRCAETSEVLAVGLGTATADMAALAQLAPGGVFVADDASGLSRELGALANRLAGKAKRTYLVGYCSPKRGSTHQLTVEVTGASGGSAIGKTFNAGGFSAGCTTATFTNACTGRACGGLGCGACDDRVATCDGMRCVDFCETSAFVCGGDSFKNPRGYTQSCPDTPTKRKCDGQCVDPTRSVQHCGACGFDCGGPGAMCVAGGCICSSQAPTKCSGQCANLATSPNHCGTCGNACPLDYGCDGGTCSCPVPYAACDGGCADIEKDDRNCGTCGRACAAGLSCHQGQCQCTTMCPGGACVRAEWDPQNCGACGNICPDGRCALRVCGAEVFAQGAGIADEIAVTGGRVYWETGYDVAATVRAKPAAGGATSLLAGPMQIGMLRGEAGNVTWLRSSNPLMPKTGLYAATTGPARRLADLTGGGLPGLTVDATHAYWAESYAGDAGSSARIFRVPLGGGAPELLRDELPLASNSNYVGAALAVEGGSLYYASGDQGGSLQRIPAAGGTASMLLMNAADKLTSVFDLQAHQGTLYWTGARPGSTTRTLYRLRPSATLAEAIWTPDQTGPFLERYVTDGTRFFITAGMPSGNLHELRRFDLGTIPGPQTVLGRWDQYEGSPRQLALDATHLYWTAYWGSGHYVLRMPR